MLLMPRYMLFVGPQAVRNMVALESDSVNPLLQSTSQRASVPRRTRLSHRSSPRRAAAMIELAIILPLLLTIVFGCVDFGRFAYAYLAVGNATREAAYLASTTPLQSDSDYVHALWQEAVREVVTTEMADVPGFDSSQLEISVPVREDEDETAEHVTVTVSYPFYTIVPFPRIDNAITLQRTVVMRMIR